MQPVHGECPAIHSNERHVPAFTALMDTLSHRFLAGSVGTEYHYGHFRRGYQSGVFFHPQNLRTCPVKQHFFLLPYCNHRLEYILCQFQQMFPMHRLGQVIYGSQFNGTHHIRDRYIFGGDNKRRVIFLFTQPLQKGNPVPFRQAHIRKYQVESCLAYQCAGYRLAHGCHRIIAGLEEPVLLHL